jgi:hypothetical protein
VREPASNLLLSMRQRNGGCAQSAQRTTITTYLTELAVLLTSHRSSSCCKDDFLSCRVLQFLLLVPGFTVLRMSYCLRSGFFLSPSSLARLLALVQHYLALLTQIFLPASGTF